MNRKRLLILDLAGDGHHPYYVRLLMDSPLGRRCIIAVGAHADMFRHPEIAACASRIEAHPLDPFADRTYRAAAGALHAVRRNVTLGRAYRQLYRRIHRATPVDFVLVPYIDSALLGLATFRRAFDRTPWLGITMRTMFHYPSMEIRAPRQSMPAIRRWATRRILAQPTLAGLLTIDPSLAEFAAASHDALMHKIDYLPDPANRASSPPDRASSRAALGWPPDARVVLLYGAISERKGTLHLLRSAADSACNPGVHVALAGRIYDYDRLERDAAVGRLLQEGRLHIMNHLISSEDEARLLAAADCMWVGYVGFYNVSGVMALAGRNGMPIMGSEHGLIGYLTGKHELGALVDPDSRKSVIAALNRMVHDPDFFLEAGRRGEAYYRSHTPEEMQCRVDKVMAAALS